MPVYEFKCKECGQIYELGDRNAAKVCCGMPTSRIYSASGVIFKGSGFHKNDYRK